MARKIKITVDEVEALAGEQIAGDSEVAAAGTDGKNASDFEDSGEPTEVAPDEQPSSAANAQESAEDLGDTSPPPAKEEPGDEGLASAMVVEGSEASEKGDEHAPLELAEDEPSSASAISIDRVYQKPSTAVGRWKKWLGGTTSIGPAGRVSPQETGVPASPGEATLSEPQGLTPAQARKELKALKSSRRSWTAVIKNAEKTAEESQHEISLLERQLSAMNDWIAQFDRSFQWKVQQRMDQQLARAQADLKAYEESVKNVQEFEPGRLVELRKRFHLMVGQMFLIVFPLGVLTVLLPILFEIPKLEVLEAFYDPRLSAPIVFLAVAAVVTTVLLVRRALGRDTLKNSTILRWIIFAVVAGLVILILPSLEDVVRSDLLPFVEARQWTILSVLAVAFLLWTLLSLALYYQGWSQYRRGVQNQLAKLQAVISGYVESQQEVNRLGILYRQAGEWLSILAHVLYRPWVSHPDWEEARGIGGDFADVPFALRIAHVDDETGAKSAELERIIASKLLVQGWRAEAFKDLVHEVSQDLGVGSDKLSIEQLDKDLPHQTNNTRNILRRYLEGSAQSFGVEDGEKIKENRYLVEVARKRLGYLIQQTQSVALAAARPQVKQIIHDPLGSLSNDGDAAGMGDSSQNWDGFLKESLGTEDIVQPPLSILNFTPQGQMDKTGEEPRTFIIVPQRLADAMPSNIDSAITMAPVADDSARPVEIIVRADVAGPLPASALRLFGKGVQSGTSDLRGASKPKETVADSVCPSCHDPSCAASTDARRNCVNTGL
jgi:hypothetical protein